MTSTLLSQVLLSLAVIVVLARLGAFVAERLGQPPVVGEIVAGIAAAQFSGVLLPEAARPYLNVIAQLGLVIFMLIVGLEVEATARASTVGVIAAGATVLPFLLGVLLAVVVWPWYRVPAGHVPFLLFVGVAVAITAFPVLARILRDRGMSGTRIGGIAMTCAAIIDVVAWLVLAVVIALAGSGAHRPWVMLTLVTAFVLAMLLLVRPVLAAAHRRGALDRVSPRTLLIGVLVAAVLAAWFTESIGLHSIFGPFVVGLALPRHRPTVDLVVTRAADLSSGFLLPAFFVLAGLGVSFTALGGRDIGVLTAAIVVSVLGKIAGAAGPARLTGMGGRDALTLGVLLSTRGLTELVVLTVGAAAGLLTTTLYTILVINAVVTTLATGPLLSLLERGGRHANDRKADTSWTPAST
ncbi:cation:proton antiporter [Actinoplanes sp. NPDC020271]|uniref:cation:proton antiporter domain-containing protein n=1 Tax=Actinoplanes sp. NPDC020271 TaxID=3363896 RepID=UPI0037ADD71B